MSALRDRRSPGRLVDRWSRALPLTVMLLMLLLSGGLALVASRFTHEQQRVRFEREVSAHASALRQRVSDFDKLLQATRAFWLTSATDVTPAAFFQFSEELNLRRRYPDVQALGYAAWVPSGDTGPLETLLGSLGQTDFRVRPRISPVQQRAPVVLIAPDSAQNEGVLGFDLYSEADRRSALVRAQRSGEFQTTLPVTLATSDSAGRPLRGFLLALPVWRPSLLDGRGAAQNAAQEPAGAAPGVLTGFIYVAVRADTFLASLGGAYREPGIRSRLVIGGEPLTPGAAPTGEFLMQERASLAGLDWTSTYAAPASFGRDIFGFSPALIFLMGMLLSGVSFRLTQAQVWAREQAEAANHDLREAQGRQARASAEFEAIFQSMQDAAAFTDGQGLVRTVNRALARQFGYGDAELLGQPLSALHLDRRLDKRSTFQSVTTPYARRDGSHFYGEAQRTEVRSSAGELLGLLEVIRDVSERVEAEQALQAAGKRSRAVLDAIPHVVWVSEPGGALTYENVQHRRRLGTDSLRSRVHPHDRVVYEQMWRDAYALQASSESEVRLRVAGPGRAAADRLRDRWFELRVAPLLNEQGEVREWVASATDIHDRLLAERLAQRNEERYRGVIEGMPQIVWLTDPQGVPTYFNRRWEEYVGPARAPQGLLPTLHPDDRSDYQRRWTVAIGAGQAFEAEHRLLGADGSYRTFVTRGLPVRDAGGQILEWVGTSTDVDDSVYAENAARLLADVSEELTARVNDPLATRADKYRTVLNLVTDRLMVAAGMWTLPDLRLLVESRSGPDWSAAPFVQAVRHVAERAAEREDPDYLTDDELLAAAGAAGMVLCPLTGLDGTLRGVLGLAHRHALRDRDHELVQELCKRLSTALDNDALRGRAVAAQRELRALNLSLEERVQRRTLELEEANRELEAFSYSVSHDLRTPLRHIVGFSDLLGKDAGPNLSAKGQRYLTVITDAAGRMSGLIDSLLEFSRMGRTPLRQAPVALGELVKQAWHNLEPDRLSRQVTLEQGELPTVLGDAALLDLVFQNLLSNAIKYTRTRPEARVTLSAQEEAGWVRVTVADNGVGFDPKYADKLFGVFQRLHRPEEFEGTGIGLANVRRIVTRHGGQVGAEALPGEGAAFWITLPLAPRPQELR
ncbi:PAS domain S-box protein [Deinococcus sp. Leaf326]|uniref:PAS domain S-box protein n=1 Tax=Deinococcus sp. Leaf326 TaxID=1736338 RepID=UPI001F4841AB|nr:PAS domain S-box protein [Deinococcus sp. Leaf326]